MANLPTTKRNLWPSLLGNDPWTAFERLMDSPFSRSPLTNWNAELVRDFSPAVDVEESAENYNFHVDLPGMKKEDIHVDVKDNILSISGERKSEREEKKDNAYFVERSFGRFSRSFQLPSNVDSNKVAAAYADGVLTVKVQKAQSASPKKIVIG